jgi:phage tail sheath protein FI
MPSALTYPGVYIEEVPSGVRSISGVSTSVTAFLGAARRGPVNRAIRIQSFAEFERRFGGLDSGSEMSYAVRQFFANGGGDAWVVRVAKNAAAATRNLAAAAAGVGDVLKLTALNEGASGNAIQVRTDSSPKTPSLFSLALTYASAEAPSDNRTESYEALSMNSQDPRNAVDVVNASSELVRLERVADMTKVQQATSTSGALVDGAGNLVALNPTLLDAAHNSFRVSVDGLPPVTVTISLVTVTGTEAAQLAAVCTQIQDQVTGQAAGAPALSGFTCAAHADGKRIVMTSGVAGEASSVRVLAGAANDAAARLKLGAAFGGIDTDGTAPLVPATTPLGGRLVGGALTGIATNGGEMEIALDGDTVFHKVSFAVPVTGTDDDRAASAAAGLTSAVRALKATPAYQGFTATAAIPGDRRLTLVSGTRGAGSSVAVRASGADLLVTELALGAGTATPGTNTLLQNGSESAFTLDSPDAYALFIGNRSARRGLYALEAVDIFNLLCLPGVTDAGILADAVSYCQERRAFLIADSRPSSVTPAAMLADISGTQFPRSDSGAVYYPWIRVADPNAGGRLRLSAPCGTIAGVFARTDASRGVWKAPAGTDAPLTGVQGVAYALTDGENGQLNPLGVNCIRMFPNLGAVPWGARTLRGANDLASEWKYVPVRRLALYIEESLYRGTKPVVFEPNDEPLWAQVRLNVGAFMNGLFRQGAFQGKSPREAYFVKCDAETTTQADINLGVVNIVVGFAPLKPAEFVVIRIQQMAGQIQT